MSVCVIKGLVAATLLFALSSSQFREVKSTPVFLEQEHGENTAISSTPGNTPNPSDNHQIPSQNLQDIAQRNNNSENSVVNAVNITNDEDDDIDYDYSGDYSSDFADSNNTYYEYNYDYPKNNNYEDYENNDDDDDYSDEETDDDYDDNDENDYSGDNNDYSSDFDYNDNYDDSDDSGSGNQESPSNHYHHLITGQNGASIQVDDDGKVYMFLNVNETFDPTKYYLEVGNNTKLLLDLGDTLGNETADYELVKHPYPDGAETAVNGTEGRITNKSHFSANLTNERDAEAQGVVLLNVADVKDEGKGSNHNITNEGDPKDNKTTTSFVKGGKNDSNDGQENETFTIIPRFSNDSHISVGWSSATIGDNDVTGPPADKKNPRNESSYWSAGTVSPSRNGLSNLNTTVRYGLDRRNEDYGLGEDAPEKENDLDEDDVPKSILDMNDDELKEFIATYPELIESDNEEFEDNGTEPEMTTSAFLFDQHRDVIENLNGSESSSAGSHAVLEEEPMETEPKIGLEWLLIPSPSGNQTHKPSVNSTDIDYSQIHQEFISSNNLTDEELLELSTLERLRQTSEALGGLSTLWENHTEHHIVRRQLSGAEACGSFSRRRRDTRLKDGVNAEGQRYKRGVANVGRRLEMGNPGFRQLYNQYKNMCNFIAMVAFEK